MGHALDDTLQDILIRYKRMKGFAALWIPGTDHAGIATQSVVEKQLAKEGLSREELGRKKFIERVWEWKEKSGSRIKEQLKRLGCSCDWKRERFTLDPGLSKAVRQIFVQLYKEGLIYRSKYMVNWSPGIQSAISDLEVDYQEVDGFLYHFQYPISGSDQTITVATTRPETMLGDTAIAVHPDDPRYQKLVGKDIQHPFVKRSFKIIADEYVDQTFGSGAVKITPAHDPNDYEIGKRHNLDFITTIDEKGRIDSPETPFHQLDRFEARKKIIEALKEKNLFVEKEPHKHSVGHCQRTGVPIEPRVSTQWFVKINSLAEPAIQAVTSDQIQFVPPQWTKTYLKWMEEIRDWCISRQLWWGHQIPVWYCQQCQYEIVELDDPDLCPSCGSSDLKQDEDVLDTWFSSGLWPFSTLGWPEETEDLKKFYPTSVLVTGFDIIFFWVARMIMMGLKAMKKVPFRQVHIHALVRDEHGKKMSKTVGNVIDPLELMETYGTDAFRFSMAAFAVQGRDILLSKERIEGYRNFMTKIWNATRFILNYSEENLYSQSEIDQVKPEAEVQHWIQSRLKSMIENVEKGIDEMKFNDAAQALYQFIWNDYCDQYIEFSKVRLQKGGAEKDQTIQFSIQTLQKMIKALQPFSPFITEQISRSLPISDDKREFLMLQDFPSLDKIEWDQQKEQLFEYVLDAKNKLNQLKADHKLENNHAYVTLKDSSADMSVFIKLKDDLKLNTGFEVKKEDPPPHSLSIEFGLGKYILSICPDQNAKKRRTGEEN